MQEQCTRRARHACAAANNVTVQLDDDVMEHFSAPQRRRRGLLEDQVFAVCGCDCLRITVVFGVRETSPLLRAHDEVAGDTLQ